MSLLHEILDLAEEVAYQNLEQEIAEGFAATFDTCFDLVLAENAQLDEVAVARAVECMAADREAVAESAEDTPTLGLKESVDAEYQADVELLESLTDATIVGLNDTLAESFEQAVQRIMKSGRKLRMKDKDGKPYKTKRRAAEAAVGASMRAVFGKKGMIRKAQAGKRG